MRVLPICIAALILAAGCASQAPFSYVQGNRWLKAELDTFDVIILSVDGKDYIQRGDSPLMIDPGMRTIVVQGPMVAGIRPEERTLTLDAKPCTRYWLEAKKSTRLSQDFEPRINHSEPIGGCSPK
jgi:hypothetical protein